MQDLTNQVVFMKDSKNLSEFHKNQTGRVFLHRPESDLVVVRIPDGSVICGVGDFNVVPVYGNDQLLTKPISDCFEH